MPPALRSSTQSGTSRKSINRFQTLRLFLIIGTGLIFIAFAIYSQILLQNAKREQEYIPRIFAKYIVYTDSYLRQAEEYAELLSEIRTQYFQFASQRNFQEALWDYISLDFMQKNPIPVIITDEAYIPLFWNKVDVSQDSMYADLSYASQAKLQEEMAGMNQTALTENGITTGYAFYAKPVSLKRFLRNVEHSVVVSDRQRQPLYWRNIEVPEVAHFDELSAAHRDILTSKIASMTEIPLSIEADSLGFIYFSVPRSLYQIRNFVVLELIIAVLLIAFSTYGLFLLRRTEKDTLWIGLAKETAHQFGTPITSLMGWLDYLKINQTEPGTPTKMDTTQIIDYMTTDLEHLRNIASRFGKVGSVVKLKPANMHEILKEMVEYYSQRMPHLGTRIDIHLISKIQDVEVKLDTELFKWTLENLIKNCVDAMRGVDGNIILTATRKDKWVYLQIRDEGKGIPRSQWKKIFEPGVTSKSRGWGLGLSLAKRIINEYHQGSIKILESTINEGTTVEIRLPMDH
ncbi:MAG: HAMP domain-containing histidine kinase [Candidatus Cloacimonetes bacterium]|nr:HAMP domain-containing histidine kinase [Candidatus Cloacimonadota bacterium]